MGTPARCDRQEAARPGGQGGPAAPEPAAVQKRITPARARGRLAARHSEALLRAAALEHARLGDRLVQLLAQARAARQESGPPWRSTLVHSSLGRSGKASSGSMLAVRAKSCTRSPLTRATCPGPASAQALVPSTQTGARSSLTHILDTSPNRHRRTCQPLPTPFHILGRSRLPCCPWTPTLTRPGTTPTWSSISIAPPSRPPARPSLSPSPSPSRWLRLTMARTTHPSPGARPRRRLAVSGRQRRSGHAQLRVRLR